MTIGAAFAIGGLFTRKGRSEVNLDDPEVVYTYADILAQDWEPVAKSKPVTTEWRPVFWRRDGCEVVLKEPYGDAIRLRVEDWKYNT